MKVLISLLALSALLVFAQPVRADGCYLCAGGGYVKYRGSDTFAKRKEAQRKCGCKVTGTTSSCSNPKCTVNLSGGTPVPLSSVLLRWVNLGRGFCPSTR